MNFLNVLKSRLSFSYTCSAALINNAKFNYHTMSKPALGSNTLQKLNVLDLLKPNLTSLLSPVNFTLIPTCGFKVRDVLRRRCKDCYFVWRQERLYVMCKTHPRHKQMKRKPKAKFTWMLSHACQSKERPY